MKGQTWFHLDSSFGKRLKHYQLTPFCSNHAPAIYAVVLELAQTYQILAVVVTKLSLPNSLSDLRQEHG